MLYLDINPLPCGSLFDECDSSLALPSSRKGLG
jgi:hypothetical protein